MLLSRPALITVVIYNALQVWNNFLFPLILTQSQNVATLPLALQRFQGQYGVNVPGLMAAVFLSVLPIIVPYVVARRQLLGGLTAGFGKGVFAGSGGVDEDGRNAMGDVPRCACLSHVWGHVNHDEGGKRFGPQHAPFHGRA